MSSLQLGGGVNLTSSTPSDASGKEVTSADYVSVNIENQVGTQVNSKIDGKLADKANIDLSNCTRPYIVETWHEGTEWYRIWSDGWIEQGGRATVKNDSTTTITFLKPYQTTNYYANWISCNGSTISGAGTRACDSLTTTSMRLYNGQDAAMTANWFACGY